MGSAGFKGPLRPGVGEGRGTRRNGLEARALPKRGELPHCGCPTHNSRSHPADAPRPPTVCEMTMQPFDLLEHTADVALKARGRDLCELITNAAAGMLAVLYGGPAPAAEQVIEREVEAEAPDLLLHHALRELLYLLEDEALAPVSVQVTACSNNSATLQVGVVAREIAEPLLSAAMKAVTRHGLGIAEEDGWLTTQIVFDV